VQFFRLPPIFPCSAQQLQAIIIECMKTSGLVDLKKKGYLQNATLHFLPQASWAVLRPLDERRAAAAVESSWQFPSLSSPLAASSVTSPTSSLVLQQPAFGFQSPRQQPPRLPLLLYIEIQPKSKPANLNALNVTLQWLDP
jgi:hypothetical protein